MTNYKEVDIVRFAEFWFNFKPYDYQIRFLNACVGYMHVLAIWARQSGKSQSVAVYSLFRALLDNVQIIIVAPTQNQSSELYNKIRVMALDNELVKNQILKSTETEMRFANGSRIISLPCGPEGKTIRGYTADIVIIEEAGIMKDNIINTVIVPMLASKKEKGQLIKIGTPLIKNHFYDSCFNDKKYQVIKVTWEDCVKVGHYSIDFIEDQRRNLLATEFQTEYCAEFISDANMFFSNELINECTENYPLWKD